MRSVRVQCSAYIKGRRQCKFSAYGGLAAHVVRTWHRASMVGRSQDCGGGGDTSSPSSDWTEPLLDPKVALGGDRTWICCAWLARDHEDGPAYGCHPWSCRQAAVVARRRAKPIVLWVVTLEQTTVPLVSGPTDSPRHTLCVLLNCPSDLQTPCPPPQKSIPSCTRQ